MNSSQTQVTVNWTVSGGGTTGYQMSYEVGPTAPADCVTSGNGITLISSGTINNATSYAVTGLTKNIQYSFRVCAIDGAVSGGNPVTAWTFPTSGTIQTIAGTFTSTTTSGTLGDGWPATAALLNQPRQPLFDASGNFYIADFGNNRVQMIPASSGTYFGQPMNANSIYTIAGRSAGTSGVGANGAVATTATLNGPRGIALDSSGDLLIADGGNNRIQNGAPHQRYLLWK